MTNKIATLYPFQKEAVEGLISGKRFCILGTGTGKSAVMMNWLKSTGRENVLILTTPSKQRSGDFERDADTFCGEQWKASLSSFHVLSWAKLYKWWKDFIAGRNADQVRKELGKWAIAYDECLPADTLVDTLGGKKEIADIKCGDMVLSYNEKTGKTEYKKVYRLIKKKAPEKMYRITSQKRAIISTGNHPHYIGGDYIEADKIKIGDNLYESNKDSAEKSKEVWGRKEVSLLRKDTENNGAEYETDTATIRGEKPILLAGMREKVVQQKTYRADENGMLFQKQRDDSKSFGNEEEKRISTNLDKTPRDEGRKRSLYRATDKVVQGTVKSEQRMGDGAISEYNTEREKLSDKLQAGYRERVLQDRDRVRRSEPQWQDCEGKRQEEGRQIKPVRVENIEVLELKDIKRHELYREPDYVYCIDVEDNHNFFANGFLTHNCAYAKNGVSSQRGKAFLQISNYSDCWTGYTATPGDNWLQFYPYFQATKLTKNKTAFKMEFAVEQTYPFPKIVKWLKQDRLVEMWNMISTRPDSSSVMGQLPKENYKTITFKPSADYKNALKTRHTADGEFLDSNMALMHYIRQACWTNQKKEWLHDFIENLETGAVVFFTYTKEGDDICEMVKKLGRKAWRIDGKHHQIPTKDTIGEKDIVVCQWQSGAEALNLQFMNYWVSVSPQYSYTTYVQALGRIKRIGQTKPMFFYEMVTEKSIEADIYKALGTKRDFSEDTWLSDNNLTEA